MTGNPTEITILKNFDEPNYLEFLMKLSARNVLEGKVVSIKEGPVSTEVTIELPCGTQVVSSITTTSSKSLGLEVGKKAYAVIKASNVMVGTDN